MKVMLKQNNGLQRRSIDGRVFFTNKVTEVPDSFDLRKYSLYIEKVTEIPTKDNKEKQEENIEKSNQEIEQSTNMTKQQIIDAILLKYPDEYTKTELNRLKKEVLEMTLQGELE